jgi:hypothetical protein
MTYDGEKIVRAGIRNFNFKTFTWNLIDECNCNVQWNYEKYAE